MATEICRDPFARETLVRVRVKGNHTCKWCGQNARFLYRWIPDSVRACNFSANSDPHKFCSVLCFRAYGNR
jgi:hypothetical protein